MVVPVLNIGGMSVLFGVAAALFAYLPAGPRGSFSPPSDTGIALAHVSLVKVNHRSAQIQGEGKQPRLLLEGEVKSLPAAGPHGKAACGCLWEQFVLGKMIEPPDLTFFTCQIGNNIIYHLGMF